jgi:hypothetical protein
MKDSKPTDIVENQELYREHESGILSSPELPADVFTPEGMTSDWSIRVGEPAC